MPEGFTVVIIGEGSVGKSALCLQFVREVFSDEYNPTIEDTYNKTIQVDSTSVTFNLIDTAGQEEYSLFSFLLFIVYYFIFLFFLF